MSRIGDVIAGVVALAIYGYFRAFVKGMDLVFWVADRLAGKGRLS